MKNISIVKFLVILLLVSAMPCSINVQAASVSICASGYVKVTEVSIPKGSTCYLFLAKGENSYFDAKTKITDEKIASDDGYGIKAKKIGTTKLTMSYKGKKASCTIHVVKPYQFKIISAKKSGKSMTFKVKNNMAKSVTFYKDAAVGDWSGEDEGGIDKVTVSKDVTIKAGQTGTITVKDYEGNFQVRLNTEYDGNKFSSVLSEDIKTVGWDSAVWMKAW